MFGPLILPVSFDQNEWFIIISIVAAFTLILILPKRFPHIITILILLFHADLSKIFDHTLSGGWFMIDLYDYNDTLKYDWFDLPLQLLLYPLMGYLVIYLYDFWRARGGNPVLFVIVMAGISTLYEWLAVYCHVFTYKGWKLYYSTIVYTVLLAVDIGYLRLLKHWLKSVRGNSLAIREE